MRDNRTRIAVVSLVLLAGGCDDGSDEAADPAESSSCYQDVAFWAREVLFGQSAGNDVEQQMALDLGGRDSAEFQLVLDVTDGLEAMARTRGRERADAELDQRVREACGLE